MIDIAFYLGLIVVASVLISYACDTFENASRFIGTGLPPGLRGATINAIGSSLPELFTTFFLLFVFHDQDGFSGGIATCAGSAIFNAVVIPGLCIINVLFFGVRIKGRMERVESISIQRRGFMRDAFFFIVSELVLIFFLSGSTLEWWMGGVLIGLYSLYVMYLYWEYRAHKAKGEVEEDDDDDDDEEDEEPSGWISAIVTLNFRWMLYGTKEMNKQRAWVLLAIGAIAIAIPCHWLAHACVGMAKALNVPVFFTTVILAAAATSVPDTIISIRDARQGDYDDAVSNALGSNIFDINVALGLPLMMYGLVYGSVKLQSAGAMANAGASSVAAVQELRILLLLLTVLIVAIFLIGRTMGKLKAVLLFSLYGVFVLYTVGRAYPQTFPWLNDIAKHLHYTF
ncbi:MAG: sodium:calcium antiporter [Deltaproteobacteria bacterium]|nr:MAG: sodium:calcium antiporter [Deltaproteobacteria bacterium]